MVRPLLRCHLLLLRRRHRRLPDLRDLRNRTVSLQAAIDGALPELRREAEARMLSTCTVRHLTGRPPQKESTGEAVPEWAEIGRASRRERGGTYVYIWVVE